MHNLYIRPLQIDDAKISFKWRNDPDVWLYTGSKPDKEITWEIENEWLKKTLLDCTTKRFAIIVEEVYVGNIQLTNITEKSAIYHIFIGDKTYWGKGISQQATFLILNYAKRVLKLQEVNLEVRADNIVAFSAYIKCGFSVVEENKGWITMSYDTKNDLPIQVSVFVMVYNHENYLKECLDGILSQKTNFNVEIVVGEDCSSDNSRDILLEYQQKFPGKFNLLLHKKNVGAQKNQGIILKNCIGKYIAMCEGDDYWTDPHKLQKQVDFLEANEEFGSCFTLYKIFFENKKVFEDAPKPILRAINKEFNGQVLTIDDFTKDWYTQILTILVEKDLLTSIDLSGYKYARDNHICYHLLKSKKSICLNELTSIYRKHEKGVFSGISHKINYEQHYLIYEELYLNNRNDDNLYKFCMRMLDELIKNYHLIDLFEFWNKIQMKEAKLKLFFIYPKSQKLKFFNKINLGDKLLIIKEYFYRYVKTII